MRKLTLVSLLLVASIAGAQMHFNAGPGMGSRGSMSPMHFVVASDGTVITIDRGNIVAFTANGSKAWSYAVSESHAHQLALAGSVVTFTDDATLTALQIANGTKAWSVDLGGIVMHVESGPAQLYALVLKSRQQHMMGGGSASRELVAVSFSGSVLWRQTLGE